MHIAVFSQYHTNPDCPATSRHYALLAHIARTHRVTLITTRTWERQRLTQEFPWLPEGVEMHAAQVPYHNKMGVQRRALAFGQYAAYALREGMRIPKPDVIWGISTPLTAAWVAAQVARWRRVPWVFEVQDLWPAFPVAMGAVPNKWAQKQLFTLEKNLYQSARHILPLSPGMTSYIRNLGISEEKLTTVLNGTDLDLAARATVATVAALRQQLQLEGRRVILYAGTFGRANNIPMLITAAVTLAASRPEVVWLFMGHGYEESLLREAAITYPFIQLVPSQPRHAVFTWFKLADISIVSFLGMPVLDANSPAKLYDSLAVGTPVVVTNGGWTRDLIQASECGWYSPADNAPALAEQLRKLFEYPEQLQAAGRAGQEMAANTFDRQKIAATMQRIIEQAAE
ncbi:glycosyltransferase family 4 protein [uncultured Hymenobacter sp.]|uniref:glycosyltransferase family 4 protein n=1 Tax=uncultured Hymenobacter sp. TaxID=170016 RepID=UPI0035C9E57C